MTTSETHRPVRAMGGRPRRPVRFERAKSLQPERPERLLMEMLVLTLDRCPDGVRLSITGSRGFLFDGGADAPTGYGDQRYQVRVVPRKLAVDLIKARHYSHRIVNNSYIHLGVYLDDRLVGALQYGYAMNPASGRKIVGGTENKEYLELNRMWLDDAVPRNGESMAISYSLKFIRRSHPGVQWIQSFADERCGCLGVVYQASNFLFCGHHTTTFWKLDGEWYHEMTRNRKASPGLRGAHLRANFERAEPHRFRQFRYIYFIERSARHRLTLPVMPYPKRVTPPPLCAASSA